MEMNLCPTAGDAPTTPITIWLVDDNRRLRATLKEILDTIPGLRCTGSFHSPNAVLSVLASKPGPDVILLDIQMNEACGLDAIPAIKTLARDTQVLMLTTCSDPELELLAHRNGASDFLLKRFPLEQITAAIRRAKLQPAPHRKRSAPPSRAKPAPQPARPAERTKSSRSWIRRLFRKR